MSERKLPTLSQFYESTFKPIRLVAMARDPKTIRSYDESMKIWRKLTPDKPINEITDLDTAQFIVDLGKERGKRVGSTMKRSSVAKHSVQLSTVLKMAGPKASNNRRGQTLIPDPPYFEAPKADRVPPRSNWTIAEVRAMYAAADRMTSPKIDGVSTPDWWRALIVGAYYLGLRIYALLHITFAMIADGWLTVPGSISKGGKGSRHFVHPEAMEHFEKLRSHGRDEILLYPKWAKSSRMLYDYLRELQAFALISVDRWFGFHSLRKTHTTELASLSLEGHQAIAIASRSANHADTSITTDFYVNADVQERLLQRAIMQMRSPCVRSAPVEKVELAKPLDKIVRRAAVEEWIY